MAIEQNQFAAAFNGKWLQEDGKLQPYVATFLTQLVIHINQLTNEHAALAERVTTLEMMP